MVRVFLSDDAVFPFLMKRPSEYSIINTIQKIDLSSGRNELDNLGYGFYFNDITLYANYVEKVEFINYDTSNIVDMSIMFNGCFKLKELDLSSFDTSKVKYMRYMFCGCENLVELDLSGFDTHKVVNMSGMFKYCISLTRLDLSNFVINNTRIFYDMFVKCDKVKYIKCRKAFKEWCLKYKETIGLPKSMYEGGNGIWDIID